jgi:Spy/CpxP family protein refolding chaperone
MSFGFEPRTRERLLAVALLVVVFLAGVLATLVVVRVGRRGPRGAFMGRPAAFAVWRRPGPGGGRAGGRGFGGGRLDLTRALSDRLQLTSDQRQKIAQILDQRRQATDSLLRAMRPRLQQNLDSTRAEIRAVLTPEQRTEFDRFVREGRANMLRRLGGSPFGPPNRSQPGGQRPPN